MEADQRMLDQLKNLIAKGEQAISTFYQTPGTAGGPNIDTRISAGWRSQALAFLVDFVGEGSDFTKEFRLRTERYYQKNGVRDGLGILESVKENIENGYLRSYRQLVEADFLGGLNGQAEYLLEKNYLVPAAAVAGAALQQGLEELASRHNINLKSREDLNSLGDKLLQAEVIDGIARRQLSLITGVRNAADHGKTNELTKDNVGGMVRDSVNLLANHS